LKPASNHPTMNSLEQRSLQRKSDAGKTCSMIKTVIFTSAISEEGKMLGMNRSIQAEGGFADIKGDSGFTKFLCRGMENVFAEYVLYAMAHNLDGFEKRKRTPHNFKSKISYKNYGTAPYFCFLQKLCYNYRFNINFTLLVFLI